MEFSLKAPAKINLFLKVRGRRGDGRHELVTVMQPLSLADTLFISDKTDELGLSCSDPSLANPDNLVLKAGRAWFADSGLPPRARFHLEKRIPVAAGLGGGSSDAAAALLALNALHGGLLPADRLLALARGLGSDVAFFLGGVPAICRGAGEVVEPWPGLPGLFYVLVNPNFPVSTAWVYRQFDLQWTNAKKQTRMSNSHRGSWSWEKVLVNDLEAVTFKAYPLLKEIRERLLSAGALGALMSGSGPTLFGIFAGKDEAARAARFLAKESRWWVRACSGVGA